MMKRSIVLVAFSIACLMPGTSRAALILSDNFDAEALGLNYINFANWTVSDGTVDLIGQGGGFDFLPGNGRYVDLDGSTNDAGIMTSSALSLTGGVTYDLTFSLAGSQRGDSNTLTYGIDFDSDGVLDVLAGTALPSNAGFGVFGVSFTPFSSTANARIVFGQAGGDNVGLLLDNVALNSRVNGAVNGVSEPASLLLLGSGLTGLAVWRRKQQG